MTVDKQMTSDLLQAHEKGNNAMKRFMQERIITSTIPFHNTLQKMNLKTFSFMHKSEKLKVCGREVSLKIHRNLFAKMIVIAQAHHVSLKIVLKHSLGPVPWSSANPDG